jgi:hypothetical protein
VAAWTPTTFQARFPGEFDGVADALIESCLAQALAEVDTARMKAASADEAVARLAAHKLCSTPGGKQARFEGKVAETVHLAEFNRIMRNAFGGPWVAGIIP